MLASGAMRQAPHPDHERRSSPFGPVIASMLGVVAWLVFILLYALFWSKGFDLFQNIVVTLFSLVITGMLIGIMWMVWGYRRFGRFGDWWQ